MPVILLSTTQLSFPKVMFIAAQFAAGISPNGSTSFPRKLGYRSHSNMQKNEYCGHYHPSAQMQQRITVCIMWWLAVRYVTLWYSAQLRFLTSHWKSHQRGPVCCWRSYALSGWVDLPGPCQSLQRSWGRTLSGQILSQKGGSFWADKSGFCRAKKNG